MSKLAEMFMKQDEQQHKDEQQQRKDKKAQELKDELNELAKQKDEDGHYTEDVSKRICEICMMLQDENKLNEVANAEAETFDYDFCEYMKGFAERHGGKE